MCGSPVKFSETPSAIRGYAPFVGEHNKQIISSVLNNKLEMIEKLYHHNALYAPEVERPPEELKKTKSVTKARQKAAEVE
jgi:hypothetical protein